MKKLLYILCLPALTLVGCLKDKTINTDGLNKTGTLVEIIDGGQTNFADAAVITSTTITDSFVVNLASTNTLSSDLTITVGLNDAVRTAYNAGGTGLQYQKLPDSAYSISPKTAVIKAGTRQVKFYVTFNPAKFDPTINYMAAIGVVDAQGQTISGNLGTVYYHFIGNPIAGTYTDEWIRYNTATITGTPAFDTKYTVTFAPATPTEITVPSSGTGTVYIVDFTNTNGTLSNFKVSLDATSVTNAGITIASGPTVIMADPVAKKYQFNYTYLNSAGAARNITDIYTK